MSVQKSLAIALCFSLAAACSKNSGEQNTGDGGASAYGLAVVQGGAVLTMHPNDKRKLQVVLAQANVGPVYNARIHFEFDNEDPAGAQIDVADTVTGSPCTTSDAGVNIDAGTNCANGADGPGIASFNLTAGAPTTFKVIASAPDYPDVQPVAFSVQVVLVKKLLQIVGNPLVLVSHDETNATVTMYESSSVALKVQLLDQDTGNPIAGDTINFTIGPTAQALVFSGGSGSTGSATTGILGTAQLYLVSSTIIQSNVLVTAIDAAGGVAEVTFSVTVQANSGGATCTQNAQCPAGQICIGGTCSINGGGTSCTAGNDNGCPFGYVCTNGMCEPPANPNCDPNNPGATCPAGDTCVCTGTPPAQTCECVAPCNCPAGETCNASGTCIPAAAGTPDLTGVWYTRHSFSIQQALPGFIQTTQTVIRDIDQLIQGQFFSGFWSFLNPIVSGIIDTYVPQWVQTIIELLDDVGTIFSNLRSIGSMRVTAGANATQFQGTEVWTSFVFYWLPLCNGQIGGNNYTPPCARFDVATTDSTDPGQTGTCAGQALPSISVQVAPFTGAISQVNNTGPWTFAVASRSVSLKMGKLILVAINLIISYLTPYDCLEDALNCTMGNPCLIDCPDFGQFIASVTDGLLDAATAEGICDAVANIAGQAITGLLSNISFTADTLNFGGHAVVTTDVNDASDCNSGNDCGSLLGNDNYDNDLQMKDGLQDGDWSGNFFGIGCTYDPNNPSQSGCLPGAWEAARTPFQ